MTVFEIFKDWRHIVEVVVLWMIFYSILYVLRGTRFSGLLKGAFFGFVVFVIGIQFLADWLELKQLKVMINLLLGGLAFAILVIFAPDMRRVLSQMAQSPLSFSSPRRSARKNIEPIVEATFRMARNRVGALIVIEREIGLRDIDEKGVRLDAEVSAQMLETIFMPGSPLHDGALVIQGDRAVAAACFLPLTDNPDVSRALGSRHRAAMGITEDTDSIAVAVSEETGTVSMCVHGHMIRDLDADGLTAKLREELAADTSTGRISWSHLKGVIRPLTQRRRVEPAPEKEKEEKKL